MAKQSRGGLCGSRRGKTGSRGGAAASLDHDRAIEIREEVLRTQGEDVRAQWRYDLGAAYSNRGVARASVADDRGAVEDYTRVIAILESLIDASGASSPGAVSLWQNDLAAAYLNRANIRLSLAGSGAEEATADYQEAIRIRNALIERSGKSCPPPLRNSLAAAHLGMGRAMQKTRQQPVSEALAHFEKAIQIREALAKDIRNREPVWDVDLAAAYASRAGALSTETDGMVENRQTIVADLDRAIARLEAAMTQPGGNRNPAWRCALARAYHDRGQACAALDDASALDRGTALEDLARASAISDELETEGYRCDPSVDSD